jgi:hypothetical protein
VRNGADVRLASAALTYTEMLLQVARDYPGLPDPRTLAVNEIVFFYNGLRDELTRHTRPKPSPFTAKPRPRKR